jgi:predicted O-methyltransferase YrrM
MTDDLWTAVDAYFTHALVQPDDVLESALADSVAAGLPAIQVSPPQGKMLHLWARAMGARKILEIGTLGGYSTIWLARALPPGGMLVTLEIDPEHAMVAQSNLARAGLSGMVDLRLGRALDTLPMLQAEEVGPFDFVFIDADKPSNPDYYRWALKLSRPGSLIVIDNVVREGKVLDGASTDENVQGVRQLIDLVSTDRHVTATAVQTVGSKGYDGFILALVH